MMTRNQSTILMFAEKTDSEDRIRSLVEKNFVCKLLSASNSVKDLIERVKSISADVVVIDSDLDGFDWASAVYEVKQLNKNPAVVMIADNPGKAKLLAGFREGADAVIPRKSAPDDLVFALKAVERGHIYYRRSDAKIIRQHMLHLELGSARNVASVINGIARLTVREKEIFPLLADGNAIREVAKTLGVSPKTVETHKYHIMDKLNIKKMADLTKLAIIKDLIPI